eukprot:TRINITY_DN33625_c0_g1_i1.p1 TRINITY_DN33625_c0_g1~~TRINITY_DN33625_c0_g1_i1.p1  ORF type:complete len:296 (+),score=64.15 TRINITY_DN33625_c0_g1_i1:60-890(+)
MDRTLDFHRLAGISSAEPLVPPAGGFMKSAETQRLRLEELRRALERQEASAGDISSIQDGVATLEQTVEDLSDLCERAPAQARDQVAHRRGVIAGLYDELKSLASRLQSEQVTELQREAEVASYFTAAPSVAMRSVKLKPPPGPAMDDLSGWTNSTASDAAARSSLSDESLRAEEQRLLATFTTDLDKIQETQAKIEEVSAMVGLFATKVSEQTDQTEEIYDLTEQSTAHIEAAEKHLQTAIKNSNSYRFWVMCWFLGSGLFLLVFDYIDARWSFI